MTQRPRRGRLERLLFSFMGPPQLGDAAAPRATDGRAADPAPSCTRCGRPYDEHEIVRNPDRTYSRCPSA